MTRKLTFLRDNLLINDAVLQNSHDFKVLSQTLQTFLGRKADGMGLGGEAGVMSLDLCLSGQGGSPTPSFAGPLVRRGWPGRLPLDRGQDPPRPASFLQLWVCTRKTARRRTEPVGHPPSQLKSY
jgi:hypothetical protein